VEHITRNGDPSGYPGCVNLSFAYVEGESLLMALKVRPLLLPCLTLANIFSLAGRVVKWECLHLGVTRTVLCSKSSRSAHLKKCPSLVFNHLNCAGAAEDMAHSSLRFGIGRFTTEAEVDYVIQEIVGVVNKLREMR
jgi:cysteine desulfurase